jgi:DNA replication protein DnaC
LLIGDTGSGKTCAALCLLDHAGYGAYAEVGQLCEDLIAALDGRFLHYSILFYPTHVWNVWISANVTVLDEVGAREKVSDHHYNVVKKALDLREGKPSVVISNLTLEAISQVYDDRVASRMSCGTVVALTGDRRLEERS